MASDNYGPHTSAWQRLTAHAAALESASIRSLFASDPDRSDSFSLEAAGLWADFSRQKIDREILKGLSDLAQQTGIPHAVWRMFQGERVNNTENRPALHVALRRPDDQPMVVDGVDVMIEVSAERARMREFADRLHSGKLTGATGRPIKDIVNIGIGGSDLGAVMAVDALAEFRMPGVGVHFVSNVDGVALSHTLGSVEPESTLFVICSKTFGTLETLTNARAARQWLLESGGEDAVRAQTVAVSTNHAAMDEFGIDPAHRFTMWDWVGGRFSVWSAVGLVVALAIGWRNFELFLRGAHEMDRHFLEAPPERNLPILLALIGIWNRNFQQACAHAVLPYDDHLRRFPAYLQQLEMESNGKSIRRDGDPVECATCPIIFGEPGSNAQHSFYQLLHQGTERVSIDFLLTATSGVGRQTQQDLAAINCLAQSWALADGDPAGPSDDAHKRYAGDRASTLLVLETLEPETLGALVALYEHKVFVQGVVWDVNSFDQWGVELGKRLATDLGGFESGGSDDPVSIAAAMRRLRRSRPAPGR